LQLKTRVYGFDSEFVGRHYHLFKKNGIQENQVLQKMLFVVFGPVINLLILKESKKSIQQKLVT
jgi:hypothetical protein